MINTTTLSKVDESYQIVQSQKDIRYFEPLYNAYYKSIYRFVANRIAMHDDAKDITSQTFLKAMSNIRKYKPEGQYFSAWLYRIAFNEIADFYRQKNKRFFINIEDSGIEKLKQEGELDIDTADGQMQLTNALIQLSTDEIQLIQLRFFDDMSYQEMATVLNCTETNARVKTFRTVKKLQNIYTNEIK